MYKYGLVEIYRREPQLKQRVEAIETLQKSVLENTEKIRQFFLMYPKTKADILKEKSFTMGELCKINDKAE